MLALKLLIRVIHSRCSFYYTSIVGLSVGVYVVEEGRCGGCKYLMRVQRWCRMQQPRAGIVREELITKLAQRRVTFWWSAATWSSTQIIWSSYSLSESKEIENEVLTRAPSSGASNLPEFHCLLQLQVPVVHRHAFKHLQDITHSIGVYVWLIPSSAVHENVKRSLETFARGMQHAHYEVGDLNSHLRA